jgi:hypothetical protein
MNEKKREMRERQAEASKENGKMHGEERRERGRKRERERKRGGIGMGKEGPIECIYAWRRTYLYFGSMN